MYWRRKHETTNEDDLDAFLLSWEAEAEEEPAEPEPVPIPELEEEDEYWAYEPAYEPAPYSPGAQAESGEPQSEQPEDQPPPEEDDEDDNLELMEWTGNRGETRLTRIARGAGERGKPSSSLLVSQQLTHRLHRFVWSDVYEARARIHKYDVPDGT